MKQKLIPKPDISITNGFHHGLAQSLKILEYNNEALVRYLKESASHNRFLSYTGDSAQDSDAFLAYDHSQPSLYDEIMEQVTYSAYRLDKDLCERLLSLLDTNGYFTLPYQEVVKACQQDSVIVKKHIAMLRTFEPHGLFAFSLSECLKIQCKLSSYPHKESAFVLCDSLEDMAHGRWNRVCTRTQLALEDIQMYYAFLQTLHPKPAANYNSVSTYVNPEFIITTQDNTIHVQLIQDELAIEVVETDCKDANKEVQLFLQKQRQEAKTIMDSIQKRNMTLLQIMQVICDIQSGFFLREQTRVHCTLQMVANATQLHTSTISRAIANKSCEFNARYYTLKSFFHSGGDGAHTKEDIQARIVTLIKEEDTTHPLSDEALRKKLAIQDIHISRRAIAKYRESAFIYSSQQRKKEI